MSELQKIIQQNNPEVNFTHGLAERTEVKLPNQMSAPEDPHMAEAHRVGEIIEIIEEADRNRTAINPLDYVNGQYELAQKLSDESLMDHGKASEEYRIAEERVELLGKAVVAISANSGKPGNLQPLIEEKRDLQMMHIDASRKAKKGHKAIYSGKKPRTSTHNSSHRSGLRVGPA